MPDQPQKTLAVLIDADNTTPAILDGLLAEIAKYGVASVKRIYGDWTSPNLAGWKKMLLSHAIQPIQQFGYTRGKNATDTAMIIDAMDLLYSNRFDGFCLVSSDSDFTRLASRIREAGLTVYGFGERRTPDSFVAACDRFTYNEILRAPTPDEADAAPAKGKSEVKDNAELITLLRDAVTAVEDEDGWANLGVVGQRISNQHSSFDARNYGFQKLGELVRTTGAFDIDERRSEEGSRHANIYIKAKPRPKSRRRRR
ncbi:MAG TPA: NYN domain-containing protein [Xanthomonadaceae bacterium]|nr:NYN domain-containing protein [Xanthomonadaceae bacterium]